MSGTYVFISNI